MSSALPLTITNSPLPEGLDFTPQQLCDALVARLSIETQDQLALFATGDVAPTSNVGPWLRGGVEWYVWFDSLGAYAPIVLHPESLRFSLATTVDTPPDPTKYDFWVKRDFATQSGVGIFIYNQLTSQWEDIYKTTLSNYATKSYVASAITASSVRYPAAAKLTGVQSITVDGNYNKILFNQPIIDPNNALDSANSRYVAPVNGIYRVNSSLQIDNDTAVASGMEFSFKIVVNGNLSDPLAPASGDSVASPPGARWYPQVGGFVNAAKGDAIEAWIYGFDGTGTGSVNIAASCQLYVELVQAT